MADAIEILSGVLLISGSVFCIIGGIGLVRMPEFFSRMHGAGITDTLGTALLIFGLLVHHEGELLIHYFTGNIDGEGLFQGSLISVKLAMILIILWLTSPTSSHAIAKAARIAGLQPRTDSEDS